MPIVLNSGNPGTLVLSETDLAFVAKADDQAIALVQLKAEYGLPAHAPVVADNGGEWLSGDVIFVRGQKLTRGFDVRRRYARGLRTARHSCIG